MKREEREEKKKKNQMTENNQRAIKRHVRDNALAPAGGIDATT